MHEQLYLKEKSFFKPACLACGILLLPFALFNFAYVNGEPSFAFCFDTALLLFSVGLSLTFFLPLEQNMALLNIPYAALLVTEFLRFGTVSIFNRKLSFDYYLASVAMMATAFGMEFFIFFIAQGKIRSRLPLFVFPAVMIALTVCSLVFSIVPFAVRSEIVTGDRIYSLSRGIAMLIAQLPAILLGIALQSDKVKKEKESV